MLGDGRPARAIAAFREGLMSGIFAIRCFGLGDLGIAFFAGFLVKGIGDFEIFEATLFGGFGGVVFIFAVLGGTGFAGNVSRETAFVGAFFGFASMTGFGAGFSAEVSAFRATSSRRPASWKVKVTTNSFGRVRPVPLD